MANILIAIATLIISFVLISFGTYQGYYSMKRTEYSTRIGGSVSRLVTYVGQSKDDLGRLPGLADLDSGRLTAEGFNAGANGVSYKAGSTATYSWVCARSLLLEGWMIEAMQRVKDAWPTAVLGGPCDTSGGPSGGVVSVTVRVS